jgi:hypothetical protein
MDMEMEEAGRKRERLAEAAGAGKKQARQKKLSGKISAASQAVPFHGQETDPLSKLVEDLRLDQAVARRNKENPGMEPIVVEELTEQERMEFVREDRAREIRVLHEISERMYAKLLASEAELARAPPPPPDPNQEDRSELDYSEYRRSWYDKWSSQYGSFEDTSK